MDEGALAAAQGGAMEENSSASLVRCLFQKGEVNITIVMLARAHTSFQKIIRLDVGEVRRRRNAEGRAKRGVRQGQVLIMSDYRKGRF